MTGNIKVSVVVPVYNREKYLRQCVNSIVSQTLKEIEIILVDDGSTDSSPAICDEYAARDSRVKVIHKQNAGMGAAYNTGMAAAKGEYIGFVEADDWIEPEMYKELYYKAVEEDVDMVKSLFTRVDGAKKFLTNQYGNHLFNQRLGNLSVTAPELVFGHYSTWSAIYRRDFIVRYKIQYPERPGATAQDVDFAWRIFTQLQSCYLVPKSYYNYRIDVPDSSSNQGYKTALNSLAASRDTFKWLLSNDTDSRFMELFYKTAFNSASFSNSRRCKGINKIKHAKSVARVFAPYIARMQFMRFSQQQKREFLCILRYPVWYALRQMLFRK